jgi:tetratricopeptide (TPR) repeat protein
MVGARFEQAAAHFEEAIALFQSVGRSHPAARVEARLGESIWMSAGRAEEALERMETAYGVLAGDEPDEDLATLAAQLGRLHWFHGDLDLAATRLEDALEIAEARWLPELLSQGLNSKSLLLMSRGRHEEGVALLKHALEIAVDNDLSSAATRAYNNIATGELSADRYESSLGYASKGLELARKLGYRRDEWQFLIQLIQCADATGDWDEAVRWASEAPAPEDASADAQVWLAAIRSSLIPIYVNRGMQDEAERALADLLPWAESSTDVQDQAFIASVRAMVLQGAGSHAGAVDDADAGLRFRGSLSLLHDATRACFTVGMQAALDAGDLAKVDELVALIENARPADVAPLLRAAALRGKAGAAAARQERGGVEPPLKTAAGILREIGAPFPLAVTLLQHGRWLAEQGQADTAIPLLSEARTIFERLKAGPWLERLARVEPAALQATAAG